MVASGKVDERVPLLAERDVQSSSADSPMEARTRPSSRRRKDTPLPILQLLVLAFVRLAEPVSFTQASGFGHTLAFPRSTIASTRYFPT